MICARARANVVCAPPERRALARAPAPPPAGSAARWRRRGRGGAPGPGSGAAVARSDEVACPALPTRPKVWADLEAKAALGSAESRTNQPQFGHVCRQRVRCARPSSSRLRLNLDRIRPNLTCDRPNSNRTRPTFRAEFEQICAGFGHMRAKFQMRSGFDQI